MKPSELPVALAALEPVSKKKKPEPIQPLEMPNIKPKPNIQKTIAPRKMSIRFFLMMLPTFLVRVKPASTMAKPAGTKKTKKNCYANPGNIVLVAKRCQRICGCIGHKTRKLNQTAMLLN